MGPPPKYLIERKLIRSVSKKVVPKNPLLPPEYFSGLMNCWKTHGVGSTKCLDDEQKYDFVALWLICRHNRKLRSLGRNSKI